MLTSFALVGAALTIVGSSALPAENEGGVKVPFARRSLSSGASQGQVNGLALLASLNRTLHKYNAGSLGTYSTSSGDLLSLFERANVPLTDQVEDGTDELYYGNIAVGPSPAQIFTTDFDTGSADLFVPGPSCGTAQGCTGTVKYNQRGQDQKRTTAVTYGSGQVAGEDYFDTVSVGGLAATHTNLISLTTAQGFSGSNASSLLGMGFSTIANSGQPTYFENLIAQKKVTTPEFSFFLGRGVSGTAGLSELTLGGRDTSRFTGAITSVPVTKKGYWQVALDSVNVNGKSAGATTKGQAAIDTGTTIVLAPTAAAAAIFAAFPGAFPVPLASGSATITLYAYPCNSKAVVSITFAGKQFNINAKDFSLGQLTSSFADMVGFSVPLIDALIPAYCVAAIGGADLDPTQNLYVVGDTFLKNWYSIYSYTGSASVSFAAAKGNNP